jgi:hypothetical protein
MGGSLHILSVYGLVDLGEMLKSSQAVNDVVDTTSSRKISPAIRTDIAGRIDNYGWDMVPIPSQGAFMITRPLVSGSPDLQYIEHTGLGSWSFWRGLPANCATEYNGIVYIGDTSGVVHKLQGGIDGVLLNGTGGMDVEFSFLTSFNDLQSPGIFKQPHFFRPSFISETGAHPVYTVTARFDYDFAEIATVPAGGASTGSLWDTATWDSGIWGGGIEASNKVLGGAGMGRTLALAVRGTSRDLAVFLDCDIVWSAGGSL